MVPLEKLQVIENESDALRLLHHIGSQKQRPIYQRNIRCHFLCEEVNFKQNSDDPTVGSLIVDGYGTLLTFKREWISPHTWIGRLSNGANRSKEGTRRIYFPGRSKSRSSRITEIRK
jgi:hypothetical protein